MGLKIKRALIKMIIRMITSIQRFPETISIATAMVIIGIILNHNNTDEETLVRILLVLAIGIPISASFKLLYERRLFNKKLYFSIDGLLAVTLLIYYFLLPENLDHQFIVRYITVSILLYLVFTLVPYFYKRKFYTIYCLKLVVSFFTTYLYTIVLYLGLMAIVFTVNSLFDLNMDEIIYFDMLLIAIGIFGITFFLGSLPKRDEDLSIIQYPKVLKVLFVSIIMPLLSAYTVVLYAYFIKIIITLQWPEGLVGHLVLWYGIISIITLLAIESLGEKNTFIATYKCYFPYAFLLPLGMMFITISIRINAFGITLLRYYVFLSGIWFLITMGYYIFKLKFKALLIISTLIILMIISVYGPANGLRISFNSQNNRLEALLSDYNMLEDNEIIKRTDLDQQEQSSINSILYYFASYDALDQVNILPDEFSLNEMDEVFGFEYSYSFKDRDTDLNYYYYPQNTVRDIANMDYMVDFLVYNNEAKVIENEDIKINISLEKDIIEVFYHNDILITQSIQSMVNELHSTFDPQGDSRQEELIYEMKNEDVRLLINLINLYGEIDSLTNEIEIDSFEGKIWIEIY